MSIKKSGKLAFTLAELLITMSILGVVAALTMPAVVLNYQKRTTAVQLHKFYNDMTYALNMWKKDNHTDNVKFKCGIDADDDSCDISDSESSFNASKNWWDGNLGKYIKSLNGVSQSQYEGETSGNHMGKVILKDGTCFRFYIKNPKTVRFYFATNVKYCTSAAEDVKSLDGKNQFLFSIEDNNFITSGKDEITGVEDDYRDRTKVLAACKNGENGRRPACSRLIEMDGWKVKADYPW